jgi:hypothetical protein
MSTNESKQDGGISRANIGRIAGYSIFLISLVYSVITGWQALKAVPTQSIIKLGDLPASALQDYDQALVRFIAGVIVSSLFGLVIFAFEMHLRIDDFNDTINRTSKRASDDADRASASAESVTSALATNANTVTSALASNAETVTSALASIEAWTHLKPFRGGTFHHYHLTKNKDGNPIWIYKILKFHGDQVAGRLFAEAAVLPTEDAESQKHIYQFEASVSGPHLVIRTYRIDDLSDTSVEIYPYVGGFTWPCYSGRVNITWERQLVTSISILNDQPLPYAQNAIAGAPIKDAGIAAQLLADWDKHSKIGRLPDDVRCEYMGEDETAIDYLVRQYNTSTTLRAIRDTHVRVAEHLKYAPLVYERLRTAVTAFLNRQTHAHIFEIVGRRVDGEYVQHLDALVKEHGAERFTFRRLKSEGPLMNFIILEYEGDDDNEVLFGWGRHAEGSSEAVFRSKDKRLVKEFFNLYQTLVYHPDVSTEVNAQTLLTSLRPNELRINELDVGGATVIQKWDQGRFNKFLGEVKRGPEGPGLEEEADLRIVTTAFINWEDTRSNLQELIAKGIRIKVLFMDPDKPDLVHARFGIRKDGYTPTKAEQEIREQIGWLTKLPDQNGTGTLEVHVSDIMPSAFTALSRNGIVLGLMPAEDSFVEGPMIEAPCKTRSWERYDAEWKGRWEKSTKYPRS